MVKIKKKAASIVRPPFIIGAYQRRFWPVCKAVAAVPKDLKKG
jgi:hypothetical protein